MRRLRPHLILFLFFALLIAFVSPTRAQSVSYPTARIYYEPVFEPPEHQVDMLHMRIEVSFVPREGLVRGKVTHRFRPLREKVDSLFFNAPGIRIKQALCNNKPVRFSTGEAGTTTYFDVPLTWDATDSIVFLYEANPRRGIYFIGWNDPTNRSRKQIWTQGQGIDNRHWIPCYDEQNDKVVTETIVTFDREYQVLSNGSILSETDNGNGTKTWHYAMAHPHSSYLVMLGIGKYGTKTRSTRSGVPVHLWYYPEMEDRVEPTYRYSTECIDFMEAETGVPFPWESYSQIPVQDYLYGAMENTTATVFGDFLLVDHRGFLDRNYISVNVHELAHQWFGDYITGRSGRSSWLHESFATFYPKLFLQSIYGEEHYEWNRRSEQDAALEASEQNRLPILHSQTGSARVYQKGSAVLDMMMYTFGREAFRRVIKHYLQTHAYGNVETNDLYQSFQDVLGLSPSWFFDEWIYRGGEPHYEVKHQDVRGSIAGARSTEITVSQVHQTDELVKLFTMPVVCEVHYKDRTYDGRRVVIESQTQSFSISNPADKEIAFVLFDPGSQILKKVTFSKPFAELEAQALHAPHMIDRYDALVALRTTEPGRKRDLFAAVFAKDRFHAIRSEIISQLVNDTDEKSIALIKKGISDPSVEVRGSAINGIRSVTPALRESAERLLRDSSYTIVAAALAKLAPQFPGNRERYLELTRNVGGIGNNVRVQWHEISAAAGSKGSLDSLVDLAGPSFEFRTRVNAIESLKRLDFLNDALIPHLFDALVHPNGRLRGPATAVVQYFYQQTARRAQIEGYYQSRAWAPWEKEIIESVLK